MLNPKALLFWLILACIGFLVSGMHGAVVGLLIGLVISFLAEMLNR